MYVFRNRLLGDLDFITCVGNDGVAGDEVKIIGSFKKIGLVQAQLHCCSG